MHKMLNLFQECKRLLYGLETFTDSISPNIFWLFMMNLIMAIVETYLMVAFFSTRKEFTFPIILNMIGYSAFGGLFIYSVRKILLYGLKTNSSHLLSSNLSKVQKVPSESSTQGLSDGILKPDLCLNTASAEAKNMKKWTFFKLI